MQLFNVLVVEDESVSLEMLMMILESTKKIKCFPATSGNEAINIFKNNKIDCVFLDIGIPSPDGIETLKEIKLIDSSAKVIMQTASIDAATVKKAISLGATAYIAKPYEPEKIFMLVDKYLK